MPRAIKLMVILLLLATALPLGAAIYSYRDDKGRLFLTDNPPNDKYRIVVTSMKNRVEPDHPEQSSVVKAALSMSPQTILLPNDESYGDFINHAAKKYAVDPFLIKAVIKVESDFDPRAVSSKGARGLMQLIHTTAKSMGCHDSFDPEQNIHGGAKYLRTMLDRFDGNLTHALAAYNAGPGRVEQYKGVPPFRETQNYVKKVKHYYQVFREGLPEAAVVQPKKRTIQAIPVMPSALAQKLASAYKIFQSQDYPAAISAYQDILNIYPRNTQALYNLACLLDLERRYDEAIETYRAALKEDPYMDKALYNMAIIYERLGCDQEAISTWRNFMQATKEEDKITLAERYVRELQEFAALNGR